MTMALGAVVVLLVIAWAWPRAARPAPPVDDPIAAPAWPGPRAGAVLLFLDIDGVLHRRKNESFECLPQLEWLLARRPDVDLVVSSTWRRGCDPAYLRSRFPDALRDRLRDVTPELRAPQGPRRQAECEAFAEAHGARRFLAVDDDARLFAPGCSFLFLTDPDVGLDAGAAERLLGRLEQLAPTTPG